ncbi:conjugal transfer protein TraR [Aeromonas schubertii]|uniref:Conjugal transfer protein TraR n=1 Tax=Aeromonas schubertii TaxID=652 RepID=A0ABS7VDL5_9GAMM|nr:conjugal transfer protein TraR [Aeromonas schubertii]KUE81899.1 conjugal transfer protein TraR [Aeromonas schubertii]MBZ6067479.1 conjugal transfer protein TraR [Aeromonas schubertii]MBZ6071745.1 conjugal transfer protein TraR [Aeromonas schubertii]QCG50067.1 conjugal transfer protein TraR [Aeromonas schubertii]
MSEARLIEWRRRLESLWAEARAELVARMEATQVGEMGPELAQCDTEQLISIGQRLLPNQSAPLTARLLHVEAALCQMELGLYGLCADCEEPLSVAALDQDPALQRCPRCESRYRKGNHAHEL